ncbi:hypothetical protein RM533_08160 [Croceicoccus sp. F390]|uniref:HTH crp-type domain-containing protein n=1 Tax=Croceicoccus esteveae TaxID=3075597 RepID=A0ABU2ZHS5_9SPHN|nr:hypothetical protein [Croceicoccus sp. F390]MDT0576160.1 hypothetical protein [Croceicoccus sp. F390]
MGGIDQHGAAGNPACKSGPSELRSGQGSFGKLHAKQVEALIRHLIDCRRVFDGDLDLFLVLTIVGERTFQARSAPEDMDMHDFAAGSVSNLCPAAINLQSIADFSGIPRETVRRKIETLIEKGWVARDARKYITATDKAKENLVELTRSAVQFRNAMETAFRQHLSNP